MLGHEHVWRHPQKPEILNPPELQAVVTCHGCWEPNLDPLQEQCTLLSISSPRNVESKGRALKSWVMGTEDIRYVPGGDQFKWKALAITVFCTSTVYVKAMQTDFFF